MGKARRQPAGAKLDLFKRQAKGTRFLTLVCVWYRFGHMTYVSKYTMNAQVACTAMT